MIAAIVPVHDEEELLPACLEALQIAASDPALEGEEARIYVVLDSCRDRSAQVARASGANCLSTDKKNVGESRALGAVTAIRQGARWLAFTDADSRVPADWFSRQLAHRADVVCGIVSVEDWSEHRPVVTERYEAAYVPRDDHRHIHGANLGVCALAYRAVGGFLNLPCDEDVSLVRKLEAVGARVAWVASPCVITSARREGRLTGGFASYLSKLAICLAPALGEQIPEKSGGSPLSAC